MLYGLVFVIQKQTLKEFSSNLAFAPFTKTSQNLSSFGIISGFSPSRITTRKTGNIITLQYLTMEKMQHFQVDNQSKAAYIAMALRYELSVNQMKIIDIDDFPSLVQRQRELSD
uniref:Uncharacterized protein n=1 Tax=Glossina pallidipes TaxID=7398 RepID=A0A1A9ZSB4_GLOPL